MQINQFHRLLKNTDFDKRILMETLSQQSSSTSINLDESEPLTLYKELIETFSKFDLSRKEIQVYLYLAKYGPLKAQEINDSLDIPRTEAYNVLKTLESRGLIFRTLEKPFKFLALPLEKAMKYLIEEEKQKIKSLEEKEKKISKIWGLIPDDDLNPSSKDVFQILEGKKVICKKINEMLERSESEFKTLICESDLNWLNSSFLFDELSDKSRKKSINIKIISTYSKYTADFLERLDIENGDFIFTKRKEQGSFFVSSNNEVLIINKGKDDEYGAIWTNNLSMFHSYTNLFNLLWDCEKMNFR